MSNYRAFMAEDDENDHYVLKYVHNPNRWKKNLIDENNPIRNMDNWSKEYKYLNVDNNDISDEIRNLPNDVGGIYIFYIKGINLPFIENYILYIGRCQYTNNQNIRKRACEYYKDGRSMVKKMFKRWQGHLYYRYYADTDNETIKENEVLLIRAIAPEYNESIPNAIQKQQATPAFN